jgi:hypothetical protein
VSNGKGDRVKPSMRRSLFITGLLALTAVIGHASSYTCNFGAGTTSNCYGNGVSFTSNDSLDFYSVFGSAQTSANNPKNTNSTLGGGPLVGNSVNSDNVSVSLGPASETMHDGFNAVQADTSYIARIDNVGDWWSTTRGGGWVAVNTGQTNGKPSPTIDAYAGHFNVYSTPGAIDESQWQGTYLLGPILQQGGAAYGELVFNFSNPIYGVGFNISTRSNGTANTNFTAEIDAYNGNTFIGSYYLTATGSGGICATAKQGPPIACNDAPFIGIEEALPQITSIRIDAIDSTGNFGFLLGNMILEDTPPPPGAPEPAIAFLTAGGLLAFSILARRRGFPRRG